MAKVIKLSQPSTKERFAADNCEALVAFRNHFFEQRARWCNLRLKTKKALHEDFAEGFFCFVFKGRGDRTAIELFLVGILGWEVGLRRLAESISANNVTRSFRLSYVASVNA